jgi:lipopolysaccharide biosynthesis glycosyltransferase
MIPTPRPTLHIASNADEKFFPGLQVALASAVAAASGKFDYHFYILDGGIAPKSMDALGARIAHIAAQRGIHAILEPLTVDQSRLEALPQCRGSSMNYAKLLLPEILPHLNSIVYLDADVLCFAGIESVRAPIEQSHWLLAGALDFYDCIGKDCPWLNQLSRAERKMPYINSGLMWMNLSGLREADFTNKAINARSSIGIAKHADQAVFNFLCRGKSFILPSQYNHFTAIGTASRLCEGNLDLNLHYIGSPKPWLGSPTTINWLAHRLWHQAHAALFPEAPTPPAPPSDLSAFRRKARLYSWLNPMRAIHYRRCLRTLQDPGGLEAKAKTHWEKMLQL